MFLKIVVTKWLEIQKTNLSLIILYGQLTFQKNIFHMLFYRLMGIKRVSL